MKLSVTEPFVGPEPVSVAVPIGTSGVPQKFLENCAVGAYCDLTVRYDCSTTTGYVLIGTGTSANFKVIASDGLVRIKLVVTKTTAVQGDGTTSGTFRVLGTAKGGQQVQ